MRQIKKLKTLWPLLMYGVQLYQGYRTTTRRQSPRDLDNHLIDLGWMKD